MTFQELEQTIKTYIAEDKIAEAILLLSAYFKNTTVIDDILLQSGRYNSLKKEQLKGTISHTMIQTAFNQLRANILMFLQHQKVALPIDTPPPQKDNKDIEEDMHVSLAKISVLWLLQNHQYSEKGLMISDIHQIANTKGRRYIVLVLQEMTKYGLVSKEKVGKNVYWKLTEAGNRLANKFSSSSIWKA